MSLKVMRVVLLIALCCVCSRAAAAQEIYVANYGDGDVSVFDATALVELARIPVNAIADPAISMSGDPSAVVFSADHKLAFVVLSNGSHVAVIDTTTRLVVNYIKILPVTVDALIFLDVSGQRLYVTSCDRSRHLGHRREHPADDRCDPGARRQLPDGVLPERTNRVCRKRIRWIAGRPTASID